MDFSSASVLAAAWWELSEWLSTPQLTARRDERYAARIRGALASLRANEGADAVLLLVVHKPHRPSVLAALQERPTPERFHQHRPTPPARRRSKMASGAIDVRVENQLVRFVCPTPINGDQVVEELGGQRNSGVVIEALERPRATLVVDQEGRIVVHGAHRVEAARAAAKELLLRLGMDDSGLVAEMGPVVASFQYDQALNLEAIPASLPSGKCRVRFASWLHELDRYPSFTHHPTLAKREGHRLGRPSCQHGRHGRRVLEICVCRARLFRRANLRERHGLRWPGARQPFPPQSERPVS